MDIFLSMLVLGFLVAVIVFLHAVISAPDGEQDESGFSLADRLRRQQVAEGPGRLKSGRESMVQIRPATIAGR